MCNYVLNTTYNIIEKTILYLFIYFLLVIISYTYKQ